MRNIMTYRGYTGTVEWSEEDKTFYGKVVGIRQLLLYEGKTIDELRDDFHVFVDEYIQDCLDHDKKPEKPYKGSFNVRINPELHQLAVEKAETQGISLNKLIGLALEAYLN